MSEDNNKEQELEHFANYEDEERAQPQQQTQKVQQQPQRVKANQAIEIEQKKPKAHQRKQHKLPNRELKVFLFEFLGMALFAYGIICSRGSDASLALFFLASVCFAAPFSGAHVNPAVTLAILLCRKINFGIALVYWLAQFTGAFVGAFICFIILGEYGSPMVKDEATEWIISDVCGEILATFTFITFILIQAHPDTTFTPDAQPLTTYCLVALSLYLSRGYTHHSGGFINIKQLKIKGCLNPGMAVSLQGFETFHTKDKTKLKHLWIWVVGPTIGSVLSAIFYEGIFKKLKK